MSTGNGGEETKRYEGGWDGGVEEIMDSVEHITRGEKNYEAFMLLKDNMIVFSSSDR